MKLGIGIILIIAVIGVFLLTKPNTTPSNQTDTITERINTMPTQKPSKQYTQAPSFVLDSNKTYTAVMKTSKGSMTINLLTSDAPNTVNNFVFLSREGFYENTPFHRIIKDFMIQGGDPTGTGAGGPGYRFSDETIKKEYMRGTLAMANAGPNTNGSQFFIMHKDNSTLPKNYVIFGRIEPEDVESLKTLDLLADTPVSMSDMGELSKPTEDVRLESVTIEEK